MNRGKMFTIAVVVVMVLFTISAFNIGGFTGTTAMLNRLDNVEQAMGNAEPIVTGTVTGWKISKTYGATYDIQCEIAGQPQRIDGEDKPYIEVDNGDGTVDRYLWSVLTLELGVDFMSLGGDMFVDRTIYNGLQVVMRLENNYRSVWLDAKESFGYVTEVWVKEYEVKLEGKQHSILPSAQGAFFQLFSVQDGRVVDPPEEFSQVLNIEELKNYGTVDIKFTIAEFGPDRSIGKYEDAHVYYTINMRVVVLGVWENVAPWHEQGPAPDPTHFDFWEFLATFFVSIVISIIGAIMVIVIPDRRVKVIIGVAVLALVMWNLGFLEGIV